MLDDLQAHGGQILHLAPFAQQYVGVVGQLPVAPRADRWPMLDHGVRRRHQPQRLAAMAQLPARLLAAWLTQALWLAPQPVARRWFAAVMAVLGQARLPRPARGPAGSLPAPAARHFRLPTRRCARLTSCVYATPAAQVRLTYYQPARVNW